jgi:flagellar motor switch protein FliG
MTRKLASLLTQTQRNRMKDDFDELTEEKKRRDQQRIRERIRSGVFDFHLLADHPDRQFALTFNDTSRDELRAALADTTLVVERLRELHDIDRSELINETRIRAETLSETTTDTETLGRTKLRTPAEIQRRTEAEVEERLGTGLWDKRANRLAKLAASTFVPVALIGMYDAYIGEITRITPFGSLFVLLLVLLSVSLIGWLLIVIAQTLKYDIFPFFMKLSENPEAMAQEAVTKLVRNPQETVQESWKEL